MADIQGFDPGTGTPVTVPQEAAENWYKQGKIKFKPDTLIPIKLNGTPGTLPAQHLDDALGSGEAELNFDPNGTAKATTAGALRGASMGGSDWLAVEGQKIIDPDSAEKSRLSLEALREDHPVASTVGELGGAILPSLIPGGAEATAARIAGSGAREVAAASRLAGEATEAAATAKGIETASQTATAIADAQAVAGTTKGSLLARALRATNPYEYAGKAAGAVGDTAGRILGEGRVAGLVAPVAKFATEGALIGAANAVDESELGDTKLTGETVLANMWDGGLWGVGFGLVGTGISKIGTAAGRTARRLAEGQLGASPKEMGILRDRWGAGNTGARMLEEGYSPFMSAEQKYEWASNLHERDGETLGQVVKDADNKFEGVPAAEVRGETLKAIEEAKTRYAMAGGNPDVIEAAIKKELDAGIGWRAHPEPAPPLSEMNAEQLYKQAVKDEGLIPLENLKRPRPPNATAIRQYTRELIDAEGVGRKLMPEDVAARRQKIIAEETEAARKSGTQVNLGRLNTVVADMEAERAAKISQLENQAKSELMKRYDNQRTMFESDNEAHTQLRHQAMAQVTEKAAQHERDYSRIKAAVDEYNKNLKVSFEQVRNVRKRLDGVIPWNYVHTANAVDNAAVEVKLAARTALEGKVEKSLDEQATRIGDPELKGRYLHAKQRYAQSAEIVKGTSRGMNRHAAAFGRPSRVGGIGAHIAFAAAGVVAGHPLIGGIAGIGSVAARHYGPGVAGWAMHKATRLAELKAIRHEVEIATRRGIRSAVGQAPASITSPIALKNMAPHELRMTAAQAMGQVLDLAKNPAALRGRLIALDPSFPLVAPKSFEAAEGAFRRQVLWMAQQVPTKQLQSQAKGEPIDPKDLSATDARDFMEQYAVMAHPAVATDAAANGRLTVNQSKAYKAGWPNVQQKTAVLQYKRMQAMDRDSFDFMPHSKKQQLSMLTGDDDPSFTLHLQTLAQNAIGAQQIGNGQKGKSPMSAMSHSAATSAGMGAMVGLMGSASQISESGPPGRRGRSGRGASTGGF